MVHNDGIISAMTRDNMALLPQIEDKRKEKRKKTKHGNIFTFTPLTNTHTHNHANNQCPFRSADISCAFSANRFMLLR